MTQTTPAHPGLPPQVRGEPGTPAPSRTPRGLTPAGAGRTCHRAHAGRNRWAYPRRCGENGIIDLDTVIANGLPPQVRGEHRHRPRPRPGRRLTPAGAGRTTLRPCQPAMSSAYPRRCGENRRLRRPRRRRHRLTPAGAGRTTRHRRGISPSSAYPRRCGENHAAHPSDGDAARLTPAGAGRTPRRPGGDPEQKAYPRRCGENRWSKAITPSLAGLPPQVRGEPSTTMASPMRCTAYPRRCGENQVVHQVGWTDEGLPPQVRGERTQPKYLTIRHGLTPAGAGRTTHSPSLASTHWAYPRRCGENEAALGKTATLHGLPPQVRGEPPHIVPGVREPGLTPAGAGRTDSTLRIRCALSAYPRRCGENVGGHATAIDQAGLPPQVRGERRVLSTVLDLTGLTPAGAGRTGWWPLRLLGRWAYPRRCGENCKTISPLSPTAGLPPQVRGEQRHVKDVRYVEGLTPAGAGRTGSCPSGSWRCGAYPRRCGENWRSSLTGGSGQGLPPQVRGEPSGATA